LAPKLFKSWWLLVLCGVFDAMISAVYLVRQNSDWPLTYHAWHRTMLYLGWLTLAPGACTIAAGVWNSRKGNSWLLVLNGVACSALGTIFAFWTGPLAFRTIALLIVVMALSIGIYELAISRISRRVSDGTIGVLSIGFALAFLGFVLRWIHLDPRAPAQSLHWLGSYFAFSAICMLALIPGPHRPRLSQFGST
jgi:uncharacterized membrane protein HdeD (DUF308 family)